MQVAAHGLFAAAISQGGDFVGKRGGIGDSMGQPTAGAGSR
jgi:isoaspartyl peptidase/L-asparaginase-like protein (Ntn-hydrolase superfamily)